MPGGAADVDVAVARGRGVAGRRVAVGDVTGDGVVGVPVADRATLLVVAGVLVAAGVRVAALVGNADTVGV